MKRVILSLILICLCGVVAAQSRLVKGLDGGESKCLVICGTSVVNLGNGPKWVEQIESELNDRYKEGRLRVVRKGKPADHSVIGANYLLSEILAESPDMVMIEYTANDAVTRFDISPELATKCTDYMIRKLQESGVEVVLLVVASDPLGTAADSRTNLDQYIESYKSLAKRYKLQCIDFTPVWRGMIREQGVKYMQRYVHNGINCTEIGATQIIAPTIVGALVRGK